MRADSTGMILSLGALVILGVIVGVAVAAIAASYRTDRRFWPGPRCRGCSHDAPLRACANVFICSWYPHRQHSAPPRMLWVGVVTAAIFGGLGLRYAAEPAILLVSLVEATLLLLLLVIDIEVRLVPTPVVGLLVAVALASANLWPALGLRDALLGGGVGFASFAALIGLARLIFGAGALGVGDATLALAIGCITGYPLIVDALVLGIIMGGTAGSVLLLLKRVGLRQTIPYGPFLITAAIYVLTYGQTMRP